MFVDEIRKIDWDETTARIMAKTDADVRRALAKSHCDVDDFMAMVSPAADKYLEPMARLSRMYTRERFGKTINMFIPIYITNSRQLAAYTVVSTCRTRWRAPYLPKMRLCASMRP